MKYYKSNINGANKLLKERVKMYTKSQRRNYYFNRCFFYIAIACFFIEVAVIIYFAENMRNYVANENTAAIISVILWVLLIPLPAAILLLSTHFIYKFFGIDKLPLAVKKMIPQANAAKFKYYHLGDEYIVTKCYDSSDERIKNRDVIIFFFKQKLRIINDLYSSTFDFGCYEFDLSELDIRNFKDGNLVKTVIKSNHLQFVLGYRAKTFIKDHMEPLLKS